MKALWTFLCVFALVNVLAIGGLVGYLAGAGRLDARRAREVAALFHETIPQRDAREKTQAAAAEEAAKQQAADDRMSAPPVTTEERIASDRRSVQVEEQRLRRLRDELDMLRAALAQERDLLDRSRGQFKEEQERIAAEQAARVQMEASVQFRKAVGVLQSVKPPEAKALLAGIMASDPRGADPAISAPLRANAPAQTPAPAADDPPGPSDQALELVVAYLNAMQDRTRSKVIGEFLKDDPTLASDLLERLRQRGQIARAAADTRP
jgi:hypothetical protein